MSNLECNNCNTVQKAKVYETFIPFDIKNPELSTLFILVIEKCRKCGEKKAFRKGLTYLGNYIDYGYIKPKHIDNIISRAFKEYTNLPGNKQDNQDSGFYLKYNEYGNVKRCYTNLRNIKLGLFAYDMDLNKPKETFYSFA